MSDSALSIALPSVRTDLGLSMQGLQWMVNSYTLSFLDAALSRDHGSGDSYAGEPASPRRAEIANTANSAATPR